MSINILIINPNTTASMTDGIAVAARAVASQGTHIAAMNPLVGPVSIQGPEDGEAALLGLFDTFENAMNSSTRYDAMIIACFDDTGLTELKAKSNIPVLGIGEAGYMAAMMLGETFSVVTTLAVSVAVLEENISRYGYSSRCAKVRSSGVPVLDLDSKSSSSDADKIIRSETERAILEDKCDSVVLGCAGMARLANDMSRDFNMPVIDGVAAAVGFSENLVRMRKA